MKLAVRVTPRGGRDAVEGWASDASGRPMLRLRVSAAAADGAANAAVILLLSKTFGRPRTSIRILSGETARQKLVEVDGLDAAGLAEAAGPPPADTRS